MRFNGPRGQSVDGDLVVETMSHWQVAVAGTVVALSKKEWRKSVDIGDIFGGMFGGRV